MKALTLGIITAAFLVLTGCKGYRSTTGMVVSSATGQPIPGAKINPKRKSTESAVTDSAGKFNLMSRFGMMVFGGPKVKFEVEKDGYESRLIKTKFELDTIKLVPKR